MDTSWVHIEGTFYKCEFSFFPPAQVSRVFCACSTRI